MRIVIIRPLVFIVPAFVAASMTVLIVPALVGIAAVAAAVSAMTMAVSSVGGGGEK